MTTFGGCFFLSQDAKHIGANKFLFLFAIYWNNINRDKRSKT